MVTTAFNKSRAGRLLTGFAAPAATAEPHGRTLFRRDGASADARGGGLFRSLEAAAVRSERAVSDFMRRLREGPARRRTVRDLRLMGRSRLADLGIEPDAIEEVADAMLAACRRDRFAVAPRFRRRGTAGTDAKPAD